MYVQAQPSRRSHACHTRPLTQDVCACETHWERTGAAGVRDMHNGASLGQWSLRTTRPGDTGGETHITDDASDIVVAWQRACAPSDTMQHHAPLVTHPAVLPWVRQRQIQARPADHSHQHRLRSSA
jgi:hypothetical protein